MTTLIKNGVVITADPQDRVFLKGWVLLRDDRIEALGEGCPDAALRADRVVDAAGMALLPGIVDVHTHVAGTLFKGLTEDPENGFYGLALPMEQHFTEEYAYPLARLGAVECLKAGITCINDVYHYARQTARAVDELGMRAVLAQQIHEVDLASIRTGAYTPDPREGEARLEEACRLIEEYHGRDGRIFCRFGPHAVDTVSMPLARRIADLGHRYHVGFHTHAGQSAAELAHLKETCGLSPIEYLCETGLMGKDLVVAHCILCTDHDLELLQRGGATLAHCPEIYCKRGFFPPVEKIYGSGIHLAYGTDWVTMDPWTNMRTAVMAARLRGCKLCDPSAHTALRLSTIEPAKALGLDDRIGSLEVGKQADLVLLDLRSPSLTPLFDDPVATIVYNANRNDVDTVWVAGRTLVENRRLRTADEAEVLAEGQRAAGAIYDKFRAGGPV